MAAIERTDPTELPAELAGRGEVAARLDAVVADLVDPPTAQQRAALVGLVEFLHTWSAQMNLTGHKTRLAILEGLIAEAIGLEAVLPEFADAIDLGSGAGFPGLPLAILRPSCPFTLLESRERRHHFQRAAIRRLEIGNAQAVRGRAEEPSGNPYHAAVAQAMGPPDRVLEWMSSWVEVGGHLFLPVSAPAPLLSAPAGVEVLQARAYRVPGSGRERALWVGRRIA